MAAKRRTKRKYLTKGYYIRKLTGSISKLIMVLDSGATAINRRYQLGIDSNPEPLNLRTMNP